MNLLANGVAGKDNALTFMMAGTQQSWDYIPNTVVAGTFFLIWT